MIAPRTARARYAFAIAASLFAAALKGLLDWGSSLPISAFVPGFAAVIASAAWAGPGAGALCTLLLTLYGAVTLHVEGVSVFNSVIRCVFFLVEGLILSWGSARMLRSAKKAESSEAWHRQLVETAAEGIWVRAQDGTIAYANARMAEMLQIPHDALKGRNTVEFFFPEDLATERIRLATMATGAREQFDRRLRRADGSEIWVLACYNQLSGPVENRDELPGGTLAMMTDITERKYAEYALRRSEERFRNLFEGVLEGVYQSTPEGRILAANPMLLKMLGYANESELNDVRIARDIYVDPGIRGRLLDQLERDGSFQNIEYEVRTRDNRVISVLENARVVRDDNGAVLYYEGTLTDISDRKRFEGQLRQAQKVEAMGRLASGVAHDFNTVLTVITGYSKLVLQELAQSHPARPAAEQSLVAAESAIALTRQLLTFSQRPVEEAAAARGETILLLEDEPLVRELSRDMLEQNGYRVILASDAQEAERIASGPVNVDLLVVYMTMPDMTGVELARRVRVVQPALKVLFISGYSDRPIESEDLSSGESAILNKPYSADSLGRKIRQMLPGR